MVLPFVRDLNEAIGCNVDPGEHPECDLELEEALKVCRKYYGYLPGETVQSQDGQEKFRTQDGAWIDLEGQWWSPRELRTVIREWKARNATQQAKDNHSRCETLRELLKVIIERDFYSVWHSDEKCVRAVQRAKELLG
jgi:hypothetical protein